LTDAPLGPSTGVREMLGEVMVNCPDAGVVTEA
jgi:hypothetical protein